MINPDDTQRWSATVQAVRSCTDDELRHIVAAAKPHVLRVCLYQLTRDQRLREMAVTTPDRDHPPPGAVPLIATTEDVQDLRERAFELLASYRDGRVEAPLPSLVGLQALLEMFLGVEFSAWEMDLWWEEFAAVPHPRGCDWFGTLSPEQAQRFKVAVIGAGMNGITAAVNLERAGIPYTVLERSDGVGGTWHTNVYPDARVDVASRSYSYTWEPDWKWRHYYATQDELQEYFDYVVDKYDVRKHIRFGAEVAAAVWDETEQQWNIDVRNPANGEVERLTANVIISAIGIFHRPKFPDIPGMEDFRGHIMHTAQWDPSYDLEGKRVASIGTGSSGAQIVAPLAARAGQLYVFQRSGTWIQPVTDYTAAVPADEQWLLDFLPYYLNWERVLAVFPLSDHRVRDSHLLEIDPEWTEPGSISAWNKAFRDSFVKYVMEKVGDRPDLVEQCIPDYPPLTKRLPKDNGWFDALRKDHVSLISDEIVRFTPTGIVTSTGKEYAVDLIVLATGFYANEFLLPINFVGRDGLTLKDRWSVDGARAHLGITIPSFPNLFCLYGPNTNTWGSGPCPWGSFQTRYVMEAIKYMVDNGYRSIDVKEEIYDAYNHLLDERSKYLPWMDKRQTSYYRNDFGRSATNGPFRNRDYWPWTRRPNPDDFVAAS